MRAEYLRVRQRRSDSEMFLKRDLALHAFPLVVNIMQDRALPG
jgi:hypothetical protein